MAAIGSLIEAQCPAGEDALACSYKGSAASQSGWFTGGEWVFDLAWIVQRRNPKAGEAALTVGLPLVLECEWLSWSNIWDDFDKLLLPRAGLRVMIFQKRKDTPEDWDRILFDRADAFAQGSTSDAWLLCYWNSGFTFRRRIGSVVS